MQGVRADNAEANMRFGTKAAERISAARMVSAPSGGGGKSGTGRPCRWGAFGGRGVTFSPPIVQW
jgi:hypothetical protein